MKLIAAALVSTFVIGAAAAQTPDQCLSPHGTANATPSAMAKSDAKRDNAMEQHITELHAHSRYYGRGRWGDRDDARGRRDRDRTEHHDGGDRRR
jgi:hypothetical protein